MIDLKAVRKTIWTWAEKATGIEFIWEDQDGMRPGRPYGSLKIITGPIKSGTDDIRQPSSGVFSIDGMRQIVVSVSVYGSDSDQYVNQLMKSLEKPSVHEYFRGTAMMSFIRSEGLQNLSLLRDTAFESKHQFDVSFGLVDNEVDADMGYINTVEMTNEANGDVVVIN